MGWLNSLFHFPTLEACNLELLKAWQIQLPIPIPVGLLLLFLLSLH